MVADGTEHQAKTAARATDMAVASALLLVVFQVFQLGQTHRIDLLWAILVPWGAEYNHFYFNTLRQIV